MNPSENRDRATDDKVSPRLPPSFEILLRWARERGIIKAKEKGEAKRNGSA